MQFKQIPLNDHELKLHGSAVQTAALFKKCEAKLVVIIEEVDRLRLYEKFGQTNTFKYCLHELKLTRAVAYSLRSVARKTREVPELLTAIQNGMSVSTAHKLVSQITPANQAMWIEKAKSLPQIDLEFALAAANPKRRRATKREPIDKTHSRMAIDIPNATLALLVRAVEVLGKDEAATIHAALEILLERKDPVRKADRAKPKESAQADFARAGFANNVPFNAQTFHEVNARDRGECQQVLPNGQKCCERKWPEIHHIIERALGGSNDPANLITLCSTHHRIHHRRGSRVWSPQVAYSA